MVIDPAQVFADATEGAHVLARLQALQHHVLITDPRMPAAAVATGEEPRPAWPLVRHELGRWVALQWRGQWTVELVDVLEGELLPAADWRLLDLHPTLPPALQLWRLDRQLGEPMDAHMPERLGWVSRLGLWLARPDDLGKWVLSPARRWAIRHQMAGGRPRRPQVGVDLPGELRLADDLILWGDEVLQRPAAERFAWWAQRVRARLSGEAAEALLRSQQWYIALASPLWGSTPWPMVPQLAEGVPPIQDPRDPELGGPDVSLMSASAGWAVVGEHQTIQQWLRHLEQQATIEGVERLWPWFHDWLLAPGHPQGGLARRLALLRRFADHCMGPAPQGPPQQRFFLEDRHRRDGDLVRDTVVRLQQIVGPHPEFKPLIQRWLSAAGEDGKPWRLAAFQLLGDTPADALQRESHTPPPGTMAPSAVGGVRQRTAWDLPL